MKQVQTSTGKDVIITGVSPLFLRNVVKAYKENSPEPSIPTYEAPTATGDVELHEHSRSTLETPEEIAAFDKYEEDHEEWENALNLQILKAAVVKGMDFEMENIDEWIEDQEFLGIEVPDERPARKVMYFESELISSLDDIKLLLEAVMRESGIDMAGVGEAEDMFRP